MVKFQKLRDDLHRGARRLVLRERMAGRRFDKKCLRFNEIVSTALGYAALGGSMSPQVARHGLHEAIRACSPDYPQDYVAGASPLGLLQCWRAEALAVVDGWEPRHG